MVHNTTWVGPYGGPGNEPPSGTGSNPSNANNVNTGPSPSSSKPVTPPATGSDYKNWNWEQTLVGVLGLQTPSRADVTGEEWLAFDTQTNLDQGLYRIFDAWWGQDIAKGPAQKTVGMNVYLNPNLQKQGGIWDNYFWQSVNAIQLASNSGQGGPGVNFTGVQSFDTRSFGTAHLELYDLQNFYGSAENALKGIVDQLTGDQSQFKGQAGDAFYQLMNNLHSIANDSWTQLTSSPSYTDQLGNAGMQAGQFLISLWNGIANWSKMLDHSPLGAIYQSMEDKGIIVGSNNNTSFQLVNQNGFNTPAGDLRDVSTWLSIESDAKNLWQASVVSALDYAAQSALQALVTAYNQVISGVQPLTTTAHQIKAPPPSLNGSNTNTPNLNMPPFNFNMPNLNLGGGGLGGGGGLNGNGLNLGGGGGGGGGLNLGGGGPNGSGLNLGGGGPNGGLNGPGNVLAGGGGLNNPGGLNLGGSGLNNPGRVNGPGKVLTGLNNPGGLNLGGGPNGGVNGPGGVLTGVGGGGGGLNLGGGGLNNGGGLNLGGMGSQQGLQQALADNSALQGALRKALALAPPSGPLHNALKTALADSGKTGSALGSALASGNPAEIQKAIADNSALQGALHKALALAPHTGPLHDALKAALGDSKQTGTALHQALAQAGVQAEPLKGLLQAGPGSPGAALGPLHTGLASQGLSANLGGGAGAGGLSGLAGGAGGHVSSGAFTGPPGATGAAGSSGSGSSTSAVPFFPPMAGMGGMGGMGQGQNQERERTTWLAEDEEVWGTEPDLAPSVLGRDLIDDEADGYDDFDELDIPQGPGERRAPSRIRGR